MGSILSDLAKACSENKSVPKETRHTYIRRGDKTYKQKPLPNMVKAMGPGGIVFDFGYWTGNHHADSFTRLLNLHSDPQQSEIAKGQAGEHERMLTEYVAKGEHQFTSEKQTNGEGVHREWSKQFDTSTDEAIKGMAERGELECNGSGGPAVQNKYNETQMSVGSEIVKATSETDQAVIEMMKSGNFNIEE